MQPDGTLKQPLSIIDRDPALNVISRLNGRYESSAAWEIRRRLLHIQGCYRLFQSFPKGQEPQVGQGSFSLGCQINVQNGRLVNIDISSRSLNHTRWPVKPRLGALVCSHS